MKPYNSEPSVIANDSMFPPMPLRLKLITSWIFKPYDIEIDLLEDQQNESSSLENYDPVTSDLLKLSYSGDVSVDRVISDLEGHLNRPSFTNQLQYDIPIINLQCNYLGTKGGTGLSYLADLENLTYPSFYEELKSSMVVIVKSKKNDLFFFYLESADVDLLLKETESRLYSDANKSLLSLTEQYFKLASIHGERSLSEHEDDELVLYNTMNDLRHKLNNPFYKFGERDLKSMCEICQKCKVSSVFNDAQKIGALCY